MLTTRKEWQFFSVLPKADAPIAAAWWTALILRGILPAAFAIARSGDWEGLPARAELALLDLPEGTTVR